MLSVFYKTIWALFLYCYFIYKLFLFKFSKENDFDLFEFVNNNLEEMQWLVLYSIMLFSSSKLSSRSSFLSKLLSSTSELEESEKSDKKFYFELQFIIFCTEKSFMQPLCFFSTN